MATYYWHFAIAIALLSCCCAKRHDKYDFDVDIGEQVTVKTHTKIDAEISLPAIPNLAMEKMDESQAFAMVGIRSPLQQISDDFRSHPILSPYMDGPFVRRKPTAF